MNARYAVPTLSEEERGRLERTYADLMALAVCEVPSVRCAARSAVAFIAQALNGQGLAYELYTKQWPLEDTSPDSYSHANPSGMDRGR